MAMTSAPSSGIETEVREPRGRSLDQSRRTLSLRPLPSNGVTGRCRSRPCFAAELASAGRSPPASVLPGSPGVRTFCLI
jgi:hypothetical protein